MKQKLTIILLLISLTGFSQLRSTQDFGFANAMGGEVGIQSLPSNYVDDTLDYFESVQVILTVKKDGTGDYLTIPAAIDAISDATSAKKYRIDVYDSFTITDTALFTATGVTNYKAYIVSKAYVFLKGIGNNITISCSLPDSANDYQITYYDVIFLTSNFGAKHIKFVSKNMRYAVHADNSGFSNTFSIFKYCTFESQNNQSLIAYRLANEGDTSTVNTGLYCLGLGTQSGSLFLFENCTFKSIGGVFQHNSVSNSNVAYTYYDNCTFNSTNEYNACFNPTSTRLPNINYSNLNAVVLSVNELENCTFNSNIYNYGSYNSTSWIGYGNTNLDFDDVVGGVTFLNGQTSNELKFDANYYSNTFNSNPSYPLTNAGTVTLVDAVGRNGKALGLTGAAKYLVYDSAHWYQQDDSSFCYEMWVKLKKSADYRAITGPCGTGVPVGMGMTKTNGNIIRFEMLGTSTVRQLRTMLESGDYVDGWMHLLVSINRTNLIYKVYKNGRIFRLGYIIDPTLIQMTNNDFYVGATSVPGYYYNDQIQRIKIYKGLIYKDGAIDLYNKYLNYE